MPRTRTLQRPLLALGSAFGVGLASITLLGPTASADPATVPGPVTISVGAYAGTVPGGVCAVQANVLGAAGGHNVIGGGVSAADANGGGARIRATYSVVPGMTYGGTVGGGGEQAATVGNPGSGGTNGGGSGGPIPNEIHPGSGGGGWTDLRLGGTQVLLAGGGGGSGGGHSLSGGFGGSGGLPSGAGVTAGSNGTPARDTVAGNVVGGGQGGGTAGPGAGGTNPSSPARDGLPGVGSTGGGGGPDSDPDSGGGGGGGVYGGGGGAATVGNGSGAPVNNGIGGGGGGGGSSFVLGTSPDGSGSAVSALSSSVGPQRATGGNGADGSVTLTWVPCDYDLAVTKSVSPASAPVGDTVTWTVTIENLGSDPMSQGDVVTLSDNLPGAGAKTITGISTSGGSNSAGLTRGAVTCSAGVGTAMPATLTCSRPYSAPGAPGAPSSGNRGLDPGETLTITYTQVVPGPVGTTLINTASVTDRATGDVNDSASATLTVPAEPPVANPDTSTGPQGAPQSVNPLTNDDPSGPGSPIDPASPTLLDGDGNPVASATIAGQGVYTINGAGEIVFTPLPDFVGEADPVTYRIADVNGTTATSTYTPTVTPVTAPDTTSGPQGVPQSVNPLANDTLDPTVTLVPATLQLIDPATGDPVASVTIPGQGTYTINAAGRIVFTPEPDFIGTADPVTYQVEDTDGNPLQDTYTPTLTPVAPEANPDETSGPQGLPQSVDPLGNDDPGDPAVPLDPDSLTLLDGDGNPVASVTLPGQGVYTINGAGRIVFTPEPDFTGTADSVDYRVADANGTTATSTYTPTVTPVAPDANPDTTSGPQGRPQSIDPLANDGPGDPSVPLDPDSLTLLDGDGNPVASVTLPGQGVYTISGAGEIVFTPEPDFTGTADPVTYRIADANGTTATSTYTPTVTPVAPDANPDRSRGPLNKPQSVNPFDNDVAGDPAVPLDTGSLTLLDADGNPVDSVTIPGQGTYTVAGERIVFTPVRGFTGKADPVTYQIADVNGTTATSTYTPTIEAGPAVVIVIPETAPQGSTVVLDPAAEIPGLDPTSIELIDPETGERVTTLVVPGEGTWTVDPVTGEVTFVPEPGFTGDPTPVKFVGTKYNGQRVRGTLRIDYYASGLPDTGASPLLLPATGLALALIGGGFLMIRRARRTG